MIIPAIDLRHGRCVRLMQGDPERETVFSGDPIAVAQRFEKLGAKLLHVVDLNGAFSGFPQNLEVVRAMAKAVQIPIQLGGGIRDLETIKEVLELGIARVVLGTAAVRSLAFLGEACANYPGQIILAIDARGGKVAVEGWALETQVRAAELAKKVSHLGLTGVIYTDITRDGMLAGPDLEGLREMIQATSLPLIASGGISSLDDIRKLKALGGLAGAIVGKALYQGSIDLLEAIERFQGSKRAISH